jgi:hypothetical protein
MYSRFRFENLPANPRPPSQIRTQSLLQIPSTHLPLSAKGCQLSPLTPFPATLTKTVRVTPFPATLTKTTGGWHTVFQFRFSNSRSHSHFARTNRPLSANGSRLSLPTPFPATLTKTHQGWHYPNHSPLATRHFPLSPLFPLDTRHIPVTPLFPTDTQNMGGGGPLSGQISPASAILLSHATFSYCSRRRVGHSR